jgi:hypothetical protein
VARPQGIEGQSMAGPFNTFGSPWPPLAICPCSQRWEWRIAGSSIEASREAFSNIRPEGRWRRHFPEICARHGEVIVFQVITTCHQSVAATVGQGKWVKGKVRSLLGFMVNLKSSSESFTLLRPKSFSPLKRPYGLMAVLGVAHFQGGRPAAIF